MNFVPNNKTRKTCSSHLCEVETSTKQTTYQKQKVTVSFMQMRGG